MVSRHLDVDPRAEGVVAVNALEDEAASVIVKAGSELLGIEEQIAALGVLSDLDGRFIGGLLALHILLLGLELVQLISQSGDLAGQILLSPAE